MIIPDRPPAARIERAITSDPRYRYPPWYNRPRSAGPWCRRKRERAPAFARYGEHFEWIIVAQIGFDRERKFGEIGELFEIGWMHASLVEGAFVMRDMAVGMSKRPGHASGLHRDDLVARGSLGLVHFGDVTASVGSRDSSKPSRAFLSLCLLGIL